MKKKKKKEEEQRHYSAHKSLYSQGYGLPSGHICLWELAMKKAKCQRIDASKLWCWSRLPKVPWTSRRSNKAIWREINPEYSLEWLMLKLKLQNFGHLMCTGNEHEFGQTPEDGEGQGGLCAAVHGVAKSQIWLHSWTTTIDIYHCVSLRYRAWWLDLHILWNDCHNKFS